METWKQLYRMMLWFPVWLGVLNGDLVPQHKYAIISLPTNEYGKQGNLTLLGKSFIATARPVL